MPRYFWWGNRVFTECLNILKREKKETERIRKNKKKIEQSKRKSVKGKSKFNTKYRDRIEAIQSTTEKKYENQKLYKEMEKLDK